VQPFSFLLSNTWIEAVKNCGGRRNFLRNYEKQKLCHKRTALAPGAAGVVCAPQRCCTRTSAPLWGEYAGACSPVVQQARSGTGNLSACIEDYARVISAPLRSNSPAGCPPTASVLEPSMSTGSGPLDELLAAAQKRAAQQGLSYFGAVTSVEA